MNVVNTIQLSFTKYSTDQNKTAACLSGNSILNFFNAPKFHTRIVLGIQKLILQRTTVWTLIVLNCWKILSTKNSEQKYLFYPFFDLEADSIAFSRPPPTVIVLCCESTVMNTMRNRRKTEVFSKSCKRFGWNSYSVFRCKQHFLNSIVRCL